MTKFGVPLVLLLVYWGSRLWQLLVLPRFIDEGTYIWRALLVSGGNWAAETFDGTLLHPRLLAPLIPLALLSPDSLTFFARWFNVAFDAIGFICLYVMAQKVFSQRVAIAAALFYLINPFVLFSDRLAMADGPLMTFYALTFWLALRTAEAGRRWRSALALGIVLAAACYTKLTGVIFLMVPVFVVLSQEDWRGALRRWPRWLLAYAVAIAAFVPELLLGLAQYQLNSKAASPQGPNELLNQVAQNAGNLVGWLAGYSPGALIVLIALAMLLALRLLRRRSLLWIAGALWPMLFFMLIARVIVPRYFLMSEIPLAVLVGWCCDRLDQAVQRWIPRLGSAPAALALLAVAGPALQFDSLILTDPPAAPWPAVERRQYIAGWAAGYGVDDAVASLRRLANDSPEGINVVQHSDSPLVERLDLYLWRNPRIAFYRADLVNKNPRPTLTQLAKQKPTYIILDPPWEKLVFSQNYPRAVKVAEFPKPGGESAILIYQWPP